MAIINTSGWPPTRAITPGSKAKFLERLINQEVIEKRESQITAFGKGLDQLGLLTLIRKHPETMKPVFVQSTTNVTSITAETFLGLVSSEVPSDASSTSGRAH